MIRCARATDSRARTHQRSRRGSCSVVLLTLWETLRYRVSIRTNRQGTTEESFTIPLPGTHKSNAQNTPSQPLSEWSTSRRNSWLPLGYGSAGSPVRLTPEDDPSRRNKFGGNLVLPDTTGIMRVPMQPTEDNKAKYSMSSVNTSDRPNYRETDEKNNASFRFHTCKFQ